MRQFLQRLLAFVTVGMLAGTIAGTGALAVQDPTPTAAPRFVVTTTSHDFGSVERGTRLTHVFAISNEGTAPLSITRVDLSQPGMKSRFGGVVAPGASGRITIEWDTTRVSGDIQADAVVYTNDPMRPRLKLALTATVKRAIDIQPAPDVFFSMYRDETVERLLTIVNNEERPLQIKALRPEGTHFTATVRPLEPGYTYEVSVKVPSGLPAGRYMEAVFVETDRPGTEPRIGVNVFVKENLYASPEIIEVGEVNIKQLAAMPAAPHFRHRTTLHKREGTFSIKSITSDVPGVRVEASPAGAHASFDLDVRFDPAAIRPGRLDGSIRVETDDRAFPVITIPLRGAAK